MKLSDEVREDRAQKAAELHDRGVGQKRIAAEIGCTSKDVPGYLALTGRRPRVSSSALSSREGKCSVRAFVARYGYADLAVAKWIQEGRLPAELVDGPNGVRCWLIDMAWVEAQPACTQPGCDDPGLGLLGGCIRHERYLERRGKPRPGAVREKIAAGSTPRSLEFRTRVSEAQTQRWSSEEGLAEKAKLSDHMHHAWNVGASPITELFDAARDDRLPIPIPSTTRQDRGRRWGGHTPAGPGAKRGAPLKYGDRSEDEVLAKLQSVCVANPRLGIRPAAERVGLTKSQLEYLLTRRQLKLDDLRSGVLKIFPLAS
jgi:hypothetical protein